MATCLVAIMGGAHRSRAAEQAFQIGLSDQGVVEVNPVAWPPPAELLVRPGLLVWSEAGRDRFLALPAEMPAPLTVAERIPAAPSATTSRGAASAASESMVPLMAQLDQLVGGEVVRGAQPGELLTPQNEMVNLSGRVTIRRLPADGKTPFPEDELILSGAAGELLRCAFPAGRATLVWSEIPKLPAELAKGLPPGGYVLRATKAASSVTFEVAAPEDTQQVMRHADALAKLLGWRDHPLVLQLAVEAALLNVDDDGKPLPYLSDACDLIAAAPQAALTPHLKSLRKQIIDQLQGKRPAASNESDATGIEAIDWARRRIARGQWIEARKLLDSLADSTDERTRSLSTLYQAVVLAESGAATGQAANAAFNQAIEPLDASAPADAFRAHNNYANFLLTRAQDQLYNHSFQSASGVEQPLVAGLGLWKMAHDQYELALALTEKLPPPQAAALAINRARLYALLADAIAVVDSGLPTKTRFVAGEAAATGEAQRLAEHVVGRTPDEVDVATRAAAHEILARLAHRQRQGEKCRTHAQQALELHLQLGSLTGVESVHRMLGLSFRREAEAAEAGKAGVIAAGKLREAAFQHFRISSVLAECLRERFPSDALGLVRAGFAARRAYVAEQLVELSISQGRFGEALVYAEEAKARGLQEMLAGHGRADRTTAGSRGIEQILAEWPRGVVALEYFLGAEQAWVFVVDAPGSVHAFRLKNAAGGVLSSGELISLVQHFLQQTTFTANKMLQLQRAGSGFNSKWQQQLYDLYQILLPPAARVAIAKADAVEIVPQHILHYFPFAALVTKLDPAKLGPLETALPTFLIEESPPLCYAPSLAAWDLLRRNSTQPMEQAQAVGIVEFASAPSLPGVGEDLDHFKAIFGSQVQNVMAGDEATETSVQSLLGKPGLLFAATHGTNVADDPLSSYLLCHADNEQDGQLTAAEILQSKVGAQLVVLSVCYSGLGDRSPLPGDDLFGLQRSLLEAGASNVVAGVWDVYDATGAQLMQLFLQQVKQGQAAPVGLSRAQREFIKTQRAEGPTNPWIHPYFWAVYKSTGSDLTRMQGGK